MTNVTDIKQPFNPYVYIHGRYSHGDAVNPIMIRSQYKQQDQDTDPNQTFVYPAPSPSFLMRHIKCPLDKMSCTIDKMFLETCVSNIPAPLERPGSTQIATSGRYVIPSLNTVLRPGTQEVLADAIPSFYDTITRTYHETNRDANGNVITSRIDAQLRNTLMERGQFTTMIDNVAIPSVITGHFTNTPGASIITSFTDATSQTINPGLYINDPTRHKLIRVDGEETTCIDTYQVSTLTPTSSPSAITGTDATNFGRMIYNYGRNFVSQGSGNDLRHFFIAPDFAIRVTRPQLIVNGIDDSRIKVASGSTIIPDADRSNLQNVLVEFVPRYLKGSTTTNRISAGRHPFLVENPSLNKFQHGTFRHQTPYNSSTGVTRRGLTRNNDPQVDLVDFVTTGIWDGNTHRYYYISGSNTRSSTTRGGGLLRVNRSSALLSSTTSQTNVNGLIPDNKGGDNSFEITYIPFETRPISNNAISLQNQGSALFNFLNNGGTNPYPGSSLPLGENHNSFPIFQDRYHHHDLEFHLGQHCNTRLISIQNRYLRRVNASVTGSHVGSFAYRYNYKITEGGTAPTYHIQKDEFTRGVGYRRIETANYKYYRYERLNPDFPARIRPFFVNPNFYANHGFTIDGSYQQLYFTEQVMSRGKWDITQHQQSISVDAVSSISHVFNQVYACQISTTNFATFTLIMSQRQFVRVTGTPPNATLTLSTVRTSNNDQLATYNDHLQSLEISVHPIQTQAVTTGTTIPITRNPDFPEGARFTYSGNPSFGSGIRHGNLLMGVHTISTTAEDDGDIATLFATTANGVTYVGSTHDHTATRISMFFKCINFSLSISFDGYAIVNNGSAGAAGTIANHLNTAGNEYWRYKNEQFNSGQNLPTIVFSKPEAPAIATLPGGIALTPPLSTPLSNDANIHPFMDEPNQTYYGFPRNVGVIRIAYNIITTNTTTNNDEYEIEVIAYEAEAPANQIDPAIFVGGSPFQTCLLPLYEWFVQWNIGYHEDVIRRTYPTEYRANLWGLLTVEEFKNMAYQDGTLHPITISQLCKQRYQFRSMRLYHMERIMKKVGVSLANVPPQTFTCDFHLKDISEIMYGAQDLSAPLSEHLTNDPDQSPITPLIPKTYLSGNVNYNPTNAEVANVYENPSPTYKLLYLPRTIPDLIYFRVRVYGREQTQTEIQMKDDFINNIDARKFFVDIEPRRIYKEFRSDTNNISTTLTGILGPAIGCMIYMEPELNVNPGNLLNRIGDPYPNCYYEDIRTLSRDSTFLIGREHHKYDIVLEEAPFHLLKSGILSGYNPFIRNLESVYAPFYPERESSTGITKQATSYVTACVPQFLFPLCEDYLRGLSGVDTGSTVFNGDLHVEMHRISRLLRAIQKPINELPTFVPRAHSGVQLAPIDLNRRIYDNITHASKPDIRIEFITHVQTLFEITKYSIEKQPLYQ